MLLDISTWLTGIQYTVAKRILIPCFTPGLLFLSKSTQLSQLFLVLCLVHQQVLLHFLHDLSCTYEIFFIPLVNHLGQATCLPIWTAPIAINGFSYLFSALESILCSTENIWWHCENEISSCHSSV